MTLNQKEINEKYINEKYHVGDVLDVMGKIESNYATIVCLDDAWSRPNRNNAFGVTYPTHDLDVTKEIIDECNRILENGGWLIADADDWLLPRLVNYIRSEWGDAAQDYTSGFRKIGGVTLTASDNTPDCSTPGMYGSTGGYHVVFAHKGETNRRWTESVRQIARRPQNNYGWSSVKPISPYQKWLDGICESNETVVVPCAGTDPAAIAAKKLNLSWEAIDCELDARNAFKRRLYKNKE